MVFTRLDHFIQKNIFMTLLCMKRSSLAEHLKTRQIVQFLNGQRPFCFQAFENRTNCPVFEWFWDHFCSKAHLAGLFYTKEKCFNDFFTCTNKMVYDSKPFENWMISYGLDAVSQLSFDSTCKRSACMLLLRRIAVGPRDKQSS